MNPRSVQQWLDKLPRGARAESRSRLEGLAQLVREGKVQFLCGAGMSKGSGMPLASDLSTMMVGELLTGRRPQPPNADRFKELAGTFPLEAVAEAYISEYDRPRLKGLVQKELERASGEPHAGHDSLEYLASESYINVVYTTNFDTLLEQAFGDRGVSIHDQNVDEVHDAWKKHQVPVLHIHGTLESRCLIAESDTYLLDTPLGHIMMADMVTTWFVWVGYSLTDMDLRAVYLSMREMLGAKELAKRPYVVHPFPSANHAKESGAETEVEQDEEKKAAYEEEEVEKRLEDEWRLANKVWYARGASFVAGTAEDFLPALVWQVRRQDADDLARALIASRGGNPDDPGELEEIWKEAQEMADETKLGDNVDAILVLADRHGVEKGHE